MYWPLLSLSRVYDDVLGMINCGLAVQKANTSETNPEKTETENEKAICWPNFFSLMHKTLLKCEIDLIEKRKKS